MSGSTWAPGAPPVRSGRRPALRRPTIAVALVVCALGLAACGSKTPGAGPDGSTSSPDSALGTAPPTTAPPTTGGGGGGGGTASPLYPKDAKSYGLEVLKAWMNKDYDRLATLANGSGVAQIKDSITFTGLPDSHWTYISCAPAQDPATTSCIYRNSHGDQVDMAMTISLLGHPLAEQSAMLDRTQYPADPGEYVSDMMGAYANGNMQRVLRLSNSTVKSKLRCSIQVGSHTDVTPGNPYTTVSYNGHGGNGGSPDYAKSYTFTILNQPGGKANAIKTVSDIVCS